MLLHYPTPILLKKQLFTSGLSLLNLIRTHVYIDTMDNYAEINNIYSKHFGINPPVRICVALGSDNLPAGKESFPCFTRSR